ncbi:MAG: hypothetical protein ACUVQQ_05275 [Thermogutta sp.]
MTQLRCFANANTIRFWGTAVVLAWAVSCGSAAFAHTLYIFAAQRGDLVEGKVYFRGGSGAAGAKVEVYDAQGNKVQDLVCDEEGRFRFQPGVSGKIRLVGILEDGHATEYELETVAETSGAAGGMPGSAPTSDALPANAALSPRDAGEEASRGASPIVDGNGVTAGELRGDPAPLVAAIERLQEEVVRLREDIQMSRNAAGWRDVLGGVGYILGLTGLAFYLAARRPGNRTEAINRPRPGDRATGPES